MNKTKLLLGIASISLLLSACGSTPPAKKYFKVTWQNYDGTVLKTDENVEEGTTPSYEGEAPTRASTSHYTYTFAGWEPEIAPITEDITYVANFTQTTNKYTVSWVNYDGTPIKSEEVEYGETPIYTGEQPAKQIDGFVSTFTGWDPTPYPVNGNVTYTATFEDVPLFDNKGAVVYFQNNRAIGAAYTEAKKYKKDQSMKLDPYSEITWTVSYGAKSDDDVTSFQLGNCKQYGYSGDLSLLESTITANTDVNSVDYKLTQALGAESTHIISAVYSNEYIEDIQDINFYWSGCETIGYIHMLYQLENETEWHILKRDDEYDAVRSTEGLIDTGVSGAFNRYQYRNGLTRGSDLKGKKAKLAFTYTIYNSASEYYYLNMGGIFVNAVSSAKKLGLLFGTDEQLRTGLINKTDYEAKNQLKGALSVLTESNIETLKNTPIVGFEAEKDNYYDYLADLAAKAGIDGYPVEA